MNGLSVIRFVFIWPMKQQFFVTHTICEIYIPALWTARLQTHLLSKFCVQKNSSPYITVKT